MMAERKEAVPATEEYRDMLDDVADEEGEDCQLLQPTDDVPTQQPTCFIAPEIPTMLYFVSLITYLPVTQFWLIDHFSKDYNVSTQNAKDFCVNHSHENDAVENLIQSKANDYVMYTGFLSSSLAILPTLFLGSLTDRLGRKFVFYVCFLGLLGNEVLLVMIFLFDLSPNLMFVSSTMQGLSGSYALFLAGVFGIIADVTSPGKQRAFRVAVMEGVISLSASLGTSTSGVWVKSLGYVWPMSFSVGLVVLALVYTFFFIPETVVEHGGQRLSRQILINCFSLYVKDTPNKRRFKLIICLVAFMIIVWCYVGETYFSILYLLHQPFCWPKDQITIFTGVLSLCKWLAVFLLLLLGKRYISEPVFAFIAAVSNGSGYLLKGLATSNLLIFVGYGVSLLSEFMSPMCRTIMSQAVSSDEQGALFAGLAVVQMIASALTGVTMSRLYSVGLGFCLGLPYLVLAGFSLISALLFVALIVRLKLHPEIQTYQQDEVIIN